MRRLGEREVAGAEAHRQVGDAEEGAQEVDQAALQVAQRDVAVDHQPLALVEHRRVRGVVVGAVGAAGRDDADRQVAASAWCGPAPARCGCAARGGGSLPLRGQIERVVVGARRMVRGDVERAEIVPVALDVRAFGDGEAHGAEDRGHLLHGAADRVDQAGGARARRQGDVDALGGQAGFQRGRFQRRAPRLDGLRSSASFSWFSAAPRSRRCSGGALPRSFSSAVSLPFLPSTPTRTASQARRSAACGEGGVGLGLQGFKIVGHRVNSA